jgi:hypothetical protein
MAEMRPLSRCLILYAPFLVVDLVSGVLAVLRVVRGRGASGVPLVSLLIYGCVLFSIPSPSTPRSTRFLALSLAALAHVAIVFVVPYLCRAAVRSQRG